jgi:hypothetical protein
LARKRKSLKKLRTRAHVIADLSANYVERFVLRCGYSVERIRHDYGVDLELFTYADNGEIENGHVQLQLKATDNLRILQDGSNLSLAVDFADIRLWMWEPMPVILVVYDASNDEAYWVYVQRELEGPEGSRLLSGTSKSVTFHISLANRIHEAAILEFRRFRDEVLRYVNRQGGIRHDGP